MNPSLKTLWPLRPVCGTGVTDRSKLCICSWLDSSHKARLVLSDPEIQPRPASLTILHLAIGHIRRLFLSQTLVMKLSDQPIFFSSSLTFSPTSERSPLYFGIWLPPSVSVKTISCEIENNHVERDWDGSSLSSSPSLSMDSWLLLIKSTKDWTITHKAFFVDVCGILPFLSSWPSEDFPTRHSSLSGL